MALKKQEITIPESAHCKNCNANLSPSDKFCAKCGARRISNRLTVKSLAADFTDRFLNIENAFLKTFLALFTKPDDVIDGYIIGVRKKYMTAFGYFAVSLTVGGIYVFVFREYAGERFLEFLQSMNPENTPQTNEMTIDLVNKLNSFQGLLAFCLIPVLALISRIVFWNYGRYNYLEHTIIFFYSYSHYSLIASSIFIITSWSPLIFFILSTFLSLFQIAYMTYVLQRIFRLSFGQLVLKLLLFALVGAVIFGVIIFVVGLVIAKYGWLNEYMVVQNGVA